MNNAYLKEAFFSKRQHSLLALVMLDSTSAICLEAIPDCEITNKKYKNEKNVTLNIPRSTMSVDLGVTKKFE